MTQELRVRQIRNSVCRRTCPHYSKVDITLGANAAQWCWDSLKIVIMSFPLPICPLVASSPACSENRLLWRISFECFSMVSVTDTRSLTGPDGINSTTQRRNDGGPSLTACGRKRRTNFNLYTSGLDRRNQKCIEIEHEIVVRISLDGLAISICLLFVQSVERVSKTPLSNVLESCAWNPVHNVDAFLSPRNFVLEDVAELYGWWQKYISEQMDDHELTNLMCDRIKRGKKFAHVLKRKDRVKKFTLSFVMISWKVWWGSVMP